MPFVVYVFGWKINRSQINIQKNFAKRRAQKIKSKCKKIKIQQLNCWIRRWTNPNNAGWTSGDRCNKATLTPHSTWFDTKSSTNDSTWPKSNRAVHIASDACKSYARGRIGTSTDERPNNITRASRVSSLEAFSYYPTHGSFGAMVFRPTPFTGRARPWFLSY